MNTLINQMQKLEHQLDSRILTIMQSSTEITTKHLRTKDIFFYEDLNAAIDLMPPYVTSYEELARLVNQTFPKVFSGIVEERDIWLAFEPSIDEEELDLKLQHNIF